jgi:hypothetical protein
VAKLVKHLWAGEVPLRQAFWQYAVGYGLLLNLITTLAFLALITRDANTALIVLAFALPVPYNVLITVAVWRSADRYPGSKTWADLARIGAVIWMVVLTIA